MAETPTEPTPVAGDDTGALECPECSELITPIGKQTARMALGLHRRKAHGVVGTSNRSQRARAQRGTAESSGPTPLSLVTETVRETPGKSTPSAAALTQTFAKLYGYASLGLWGVIVDGDAGLDTEAARDAAIDMLAPTTEQALATVRPFARIAAGTSFNKRFGRTLVDNSDVLDCIGAIMEQARTARAYFAARNAALAGGATGGVAAMTVAPPAAPSAPQAEAQQMPRATVMGVPEGTLITPGMLGRTDIERAAADAQHQQETEL